MPGFASLFTAAELMSAAANVPLTAHLDEATAVGAANVPLTAHLDEATAVAINRQLWGNVDSQLVQQSLCSVAGNPHSRSGSIPAFFPNAQIVHFRTFFAYIVRETANDATVCASAAPPRCRPIGRSPGLYGSGDGWNGGGRAGASGIGWRPVGRFHQIQSGIKLGVTVP
jgi:hypothetical protein